MAEKKEIFKRVGLELIDRPDKSSRIDIDNGAVRELARNIKARGLMNPITLNKEGERYQIIAGDRRFLAYKELGLTKITAKILEVNRKEMLLLRGTENIHRADLTPLEEGRIYNGLINESGMSVDDISKETGKSVGVIKRRLDVIKMPEGFQVALHKKRIGLSVAEELWSCPDEGHRDYLLEMACEHGVTRDVARAWVNDWRKAERSKPDASEGGGLERALFEYQPIYRACDLCKNAVELREVKELRICPGCLKAIVTAIEGG